VININYLSHAFNSVIPSGLVIRFTDAVFTSDNHAADAPVYPNFRAVSFALAWLQFTPLVTHVNFMSLFTFLRTNLPKVFLHV
jgi:hypothetical protein